MRAFLIDPSPEALASKTVIQEVDYSGDYKQIYELIDCRVFDVARFNDQGDGLYIDDEGLLHGPVDQWIVLKGYPHPLAGKGLILGCDEEGESISPSVSREWLERNLVVSDGLFCFDHTGDTVGLLPSITP